MKLKEKKPKSGNGTGGEPLTPQEASFFREVQIEFLVHELKGPMSVIETGLHLLLDKRNTYGPLSSRQEKTLRRKLRNAKKVRQMLSDLLEIGQSQAGCFMCSRFNPVEAVYGALREAIEQVPGRHTRHLHERGYLPETLPDFGIHMNIAPEAVSMEVEQDEVKFRQILGNLVKNALHHHKHRIDIHISRTNNDIHIEVQDDGPGIRPEHHDLVFQRYAQVKECRLPANRQGHGLGLAGAFILARCLGGNIALKSASGRGARFCLSLPIRFESND